MCWKNEWARAIANLDWAKIHLERSLIKTKKRNLEEVSNKIEDLIDELTGIQKELKGLIKKWGISRVPNSISTKKIISGKRVKKGKVQEWVDKN